MFALSLLTISSEEENFFKLTQGVVVKCALDDAVQIQTHVTESKQRILVRVSQTSAAILRGDAAVQFFEGNV